MKNAVIFSGYNPLPEDIKPMDFLNKNTGGSLKLSVSPSSPELSGLSKRQTTLEFSLDGESTASENARLRVCIRSFQKENSREKTAPNFEMVSVDTITDRFAEAYHQFTSNPSTMNSYKDGHSWSLDETRKNIATYWEPPFKKGSPAGGYAISLEDTDQIIGHVALFEPDQSHRKENEQLPSCAEIGFLLNSQFQGKKIGGAAAQTTTQILAPAINALKFSLPSGDTLKNIEASVSTTNNASRATLEKAGLKDTQRTEERYDGLRHFLKMNVPDFAFENDEK